jgi:hypothetical protein
MTVIELSVMLISYVVWRRAVVWEKENKERKG